MALPTSLGCLHHCECNAVKYSSPWHYPKPAPTHKLANYSPNTFVDLKAWKDLGKPVMGLFLPPMGQIKSVSQIVQTYPKQTTRNKHKGPWRASVVTLTVSVVQCRAPYPHLLESAGPSSSLYVCNKEKRYKSFLLICEEKRKYVVEIAAQQRFVSLSHQVSKQTSTMQGYFQSFVNPYSFKLLVLTERALLASDRFNCPGDGL